MCPETVCSNMLGIFLCFPGQTISYSLLIFAAILTPFMFRFCVEKLVILTKELDC